MRRVLVTGSAGGIGQAISGRLRQQCHRVIGVDLRDADIVADLGSEAGRTAMVAAVTERTGSVLDGLVAGAGILDADPSTVLAVNYFGTIAALTGLRPLLACGTNPSAVVISSATITTNPDIPEKLVNACLDGDEEAARSIAVRFPDKVYGASKLALARWARRQATTPQWVGAGIRLNIVAPGPVATGLLGVRLQQMSDKMASMPIPQQRIAHPSEIAALVSYLLSDETIGVCGSLIYIDGGSDALLRSDDWPVSMT